MAKVDIRLGTTLVPMYDGAPDGLNSFIDAVNLFNDTVMNDFAEADAAQKAAARVTVLRFVRTRLSGKARQAVSDNQTLVETLNAIREHCESKVTAENIMAKLSTVKQKDDLVVFCEQVEKLSAQLKSVYLRENIPEATAQKMATKNGIDALIKGTKNTEAKIILRAGTFLNINDAIQKLQENTQVTQSSGEINQNNAQIFYSHRGNNRGRGRFQQTRNNTRGNFRGNYHPRNFQSNTRGNFQNNRGNFQPRGYHQRGNWSQRGNFNPHYGMFMAQQFQQPMQQPMQEQIQHQQQQQQPPYPQSNIHPLGVPFGQHTQ